ncbi:MAG: ABC transporter ATP-binding protein, partial [Oscillospiraceae bacterium]|jgi:multiple sugar transport system ATP-binding protein|nr:ABC transporter ATP-binding protein [Oscillospiraceae bacterium]
MVFQNYALYPHMTVYKNMAFGLELRKTPKDEIKRRVNEAAQVLEIEHLLTRKPKALSGGQRQRVALGRAMVRNPAVFLLDEPLSNLDAKLRASMRTVLIKLHKQLETTFVYVTHDQTEAMTMGDRIIVMEDGFIRQVDTPQNLYDYPCNVFVAGFIGTPQMNFIGGVLEKGGEGFVIKMENTQLRLPPDRLSAKLEGAVGSEILLGIRPENLYDDLSDPEVNTGAVIEATVEVSEPMGSEVYLTLDFCGSKLTARVKPQTTSRMGDVIKLALDMSKAHLFDKKSGVSLMNGAEG